MKSRLSFSTVVVVMGLLAAACSSAPVVEDVGARAEQPLLIQFTSVADRDASVIEQIAALREDGWVVPAWAEARLENVGEFHRIALRVTHQSGARADLVFSHEGAAMVAGEDSAAKPTLALRPYDDAARLLLADPQGANEPHAANPEVITPVGGASVEFTGPNPVSCGTHGGYCDASHVCCNLQGLSCRRNQCVKPTSCSYVEKLTANIICFNDGNFSAAAYWQRTRRGWDANYAMYASYRGCGILCPGIQTLTTRTLVCGQATGTCRGL